MKLTLEAINQAIAELAESGELAEISMKYFGSDLTQATVSDWFRMDFTPSAILRRGLLLLDDELVKINIVIRRKERMEYNRLLSEGEDAIINLD